MKNAANLIALQIALNGKQKIVRTEATSGAAQCHHGELVV